MAAEICIKKGNEFVAEGEKKLQGWSFMGMFGASNKYDDCIDCYNRACAQYKIAKACTYVDRCHANAACLLLSSFLTGCPVIAAYSAFA